MDVRRPRAWGAGLLAGLGLALPIVLVPAADAATPPPRYRYVKIAPIGQNVFGGYNTAEAVNTAGGVVGSSSVRNGSHAYTWRAGVTTDLGVLNTGTGPRESEGAGLNDRGAVVGATQVDGPGGTGQHAFVHRDGVFTDLGTGYPGVESGSAALAVNDAGLVVGVHDADQSRAYRAVTWTDGRLRELPGLGGTYDHDGIITQPDAVNDVGQIVGTAQPRSSAEALHGVLWEGGKVRDLGNLGGTAEDTQANDINDSGTVVGDTRVGDGTGDGLVTATLWRGGAALDLNDLVVDLPAGVHLELADEINDAGVIVGQSCTLAPDCRGGLTAYALVPVR